MSEADCAAFLQAIQADPADLTARLVYADWLDERSDADGELIRLLCEVQASGYEDGRAWRRLLMLTRGPAAELDRLCDRDQRRFACDCAERVLPLFEWEYPGDESPRRAVETVKWYMGGERSGQELYVATVAAQASARIARSDAIRSASFGHRDAAKDAACAAAVAAARPGSREARVAARTTARAAANAVFRAAEAPHRMATQAVEMRWQLCRAVEYRLSFAPPLSFGER